MCDVSVGDKVLNRMHSLLFKMQTGQSIPVTEFRRVVLPSGETMIVYNETQINFGEVDEQEEQEGI